MTKLDGASPWALTPERTALVVGASRGLGFAMVAEFLARSWNVIGTERNLQDTSALRDLAGRSGGALRVETLDINNSDQLVNLHGALSGLSLDLLFVNAGIIRNRQTPIAEVSTVDFSEVMITNALSPMRVIEALEHLVPAGGVIAAMSSRMASLAGNTTGSDELYRGSKIALNMFMKSFSIRQAESGRSIVLMTPGWVQTALGGDGAPLTVDQSIPRVVDVLVSRLGRSGLEFLDNSGRTIPW